MAVCEWVVDRGLANSFLGSFNIRGEILPGLGVLLILISLTVCRSFSWNVHVIKGCLVIEWVTDVQNLSILWRLIQSSHSHFEPVAFRLQYIYQLSRQGEQLKKVTLFFFFFYFFFLTYLNIFFWIWLAWISKVNLIFLSCLHFFFFIMASRLVVFWFGPHYFWSVYVYD